MKSLIIFVSALLVSAVECQKLTPPVKTKQGPVVGRTFDTIWYSQSYSCFMGIPYAEPPIGERRFEDPIPAGPWSGVYNATDEGNFCLQTLTTGLIGNEDCLYLNVYTPLLEFDNITELKPVMVWIYGGGFQGGFSLNGVYGPDFFIEDDVVFVSMNYRLNVFGFLALNLPGAKGNQGLKDQHLALKWVQENIAYFGGDPNRVTIFGESAGSASVGYHVLSPQSEGLFHQAIMQSGTPLCPWAYVPPQDSITNAYHLTRLMGHASSSTQDALQFLKTADIRDIGTALLHMNSIQFPVYFSFAPTIDGEFIKDCPVSLFQSGNFHHMPMLIGFNKDEAILFTAVLEVAREVLVDSMNVVVNLNSASSNPTIVNMIDQLTNATTSKITELGTLYEFTAPIDLTQRYFAQHNKNSSVFYYRLSFDSPYAIHKLINQNINGTAHADDLGYLFRVQIMFPFSPEKPINKFRNKFVSYWTNFAKYGNPTPPDQVYDAVWQPAGGDGVQIDINEGSTMNARMMSPEHVIYEQAYHTALPITTQCPSFSYFSQGPF